MEQGIGASETRIWLESFAFKRGIASLSKLSCPILVRHLRILVQILVKTAENVLSTNHEHAESTPLPSDRNDRPLSTTSVQRKRPTSFSLANKADRQEH